MRMLAWLCAFVSTVALADGVTVVRRTGAPAVYTDIIFWSTHETAGPVTASPYTLGTGECSGTTTCAAGDQTGVLNGNPGTADPGIDTNSAASKNGTYGLRVQAGTAGLQYIQYVTGAGTGAEMLAGAEGSIGAWVQFVESATGSYRFILADGGTGQIKIDYFGDGSGFPNAINFEIIDPTTPRTVDCQTANNVVSVGAWYYLEFKWQASSDFLIVKSTTTGGTTTTTTCDFTGTPFVAIAPANFYYGNIQNGSGEDPNVYFDDMAISNSYTRDLTALRDLTASPR